MLNKRIAFALLSSLFVALLLAAALAGANQMDVPTEGYREEAVDSCEGVIIGNADGNTEAPLVDIDDIVYLIHYMFVSGPTPIPYPVASGDANCDCLVDIDDIVYLISGIIDPSGLLFGPPPVTCEVWVETCGPLH
jgi:hypothetical protein